MWSLKTEIYIYIQIYKNNELMYRNKHEHWIKCTGIYVNNVLLYRNIHKQWIIVQEYT